MNYKKWLAFSLLLVLAGACAKYEEGSNFSLLSAKSRLVNTWILTKYEVNGQDETANNAGLEMIFNKDNTFKRTFILNFQISEDGDWAFAEGKESIILTKSNGDIEAYKIIQLKNKAFKAKRIDSGGSTYVYTFKEK
jgi:hypothetical protein